LVDLTDELAAVDEDVGTHDDVPDDVPEEVPDDVTEEVPDDVTEDVGADEVEEALDDEPHVDEAHVDEAPVDELPQDEDATDDEEEDEATVDDATDEEAHVDEEVGAVLLDDDQADVDFFPPSTSSCGRAAANDATRASSATFGIIVTAPTQRGSSECMFYHVTFDMAHGVGSSDTGQMQW
jgi:hypothetical protein